MFLKNLVINLAETCHVTFTCISLQVSKYKLNYLVCKNVFQIIYFYAVRQGHALLTGSNVHPMCL